MGLFFLLLMKIKAKNLWNLPERQPGDNHAAGGLCESYKAQYLGPEKVGSLDRKLSDPAG